MCGPDLPAHGVFAVAEEIRHLQRLLDFPKEDLHAPVELVELADSEGRPFEVVGDEGHFHHLPLDFHFGCHQPDFLRMLDATRIVRFSRHVLVPENIVRASERDLAVGRCTYRGS